MYSSKFVRILRNTVSTYFNIPQKGGLNEKLTWLKRITTKATQNDSNLTLDVTFSGDPIHHCYPYIWLRDNCQCVKCFGETTSQRNVLVKDLDVNIRPTGVEINNEGGININWPDGHLSTYCYKWLQDRSFKENDRQTLYPSWETKAKPWGSEMQQKLLKVKYNELMSSDESLYKWIVTLAEDGICLITGAPTEPDILKSIGKRVAYLRKTHYGEIFLVKSKENPSNVAYTGGSLGLHTDLSYCNYTPGMQMLHCIAQVPSTGGDNEFVDGFFVAGLMKKEYPDLYQVLLNTPIRFVDLGVDHYSFHYVSQFSFIQENEAGEVVKINSNNHSRSSYTGLSSSEIKEFYKALTTFEAFMNDPRSLITHKLGKGEIICLHNHRILHGRKGYQTVGTGERYLEGGYIDWDEMHSKRRVLAQQHDKIINV